MADYCPMGEPADCIWWTKDRTARMHHKCRSCGSAIDPGETYRTHCGMWEGDIIHIKLCMKCAELEELIYQKTSCESVPFDMIAEVAVANGLA